MRCSYWICGRARQSGVTTFEHDEPSSGKTVTDLVLAMDKNVHQSVQEVQDGIVQAMTEYLRKPM